MVNPDDYEPRGHSGYWYRKDGPTTRMVPFKWKLCEGCGQRFLGKLSQRFCDTSCGKVGSRHPQWKGDAAGASALHKRLGKVTECVFGCNHSWYDWANLTGDYTDPDAYAALCRRCHKRFDMAVIMLQRDVIADYRGWRPWLSEAA